MGRTDSLEKTLMLGKIEGRRRGQQRMVGWHHRFNGHELEQTVGDSKGQGSLACCNPWGCQESDTTKQLNWTELIYTHIYSTYIHIYIYIYVDNCIAQLCLWEKQQGEPFLGHSALVKQAIHVQHWICTQNPENFRLSTSLLKNQCIDWPINRILIWWAIFFSLSWHTS